MHNLKYSEAFVDNVSYRMRRAHPHDAWCGTVHVESHANKVQHVGLETVVLDVRDEGFSVLVLLSFDGLAS